MSINPSEFGFARGAEAGNTSPFAAALRFNLVRIAEMVERLASEDIQPTAEVALRQTLDDLLGIAGATTEATFEVRSCLRDERSCEACLELHGTVVRIGTDEHTAFKPPNHCKGGANCRCEYLPVPHGRSGMMFSAYLVESSAYRVAGEVVLEKITDAAIQARELAAVNAARFGPGPKILRERERRRLHHDISETIKFRSLSDRAQEIEAVRTVRQVLTTGRPRLAENTLAAIEYLVKHGQPPPFTPKSNRGFVRSGSGAGVML